jgi:hypothetical protein
MHTNRLTPEPSFLPRPLPSATVEHVNGQRVFATTEALVDMKTPIRKRCTKCHELKSLDDFNRMARSKDGRQYYCKSCHATARTASRERAMRRRPNTPTTRRSMIQKPNKMNTPKGWTALSVRHETNQLVGELAERFGVAKSDVLALALKTLETQPQMLRVAQIRAQINKLQDELSVVTASEAAVTPTWDTPAPAAKKTPKKVVKSKATAGLPVCTRPACGRPARGGFKMCLHHRREAREHQAKRMAKLKRAAKRAANQYQQQEPAPANG